jgi:DNA-nicking Smr family endonuclease
MKGVKPAKVRVKRPAVSAEDREMFLAAMGGATPLGTRDRIALPPPLPAVVKVIELPPEVKLAVEGDGGRYTARAPGVSRAQLGDLRSGKLHAEATLDLHGETAERGKAALREFLVDNVRIGRHCVLVVHGKGLHSETGLAILREAVHGELLGALSGFVHAFATAAPADGGEGATYILLRGGRK